MVNTTSSRAGVALDPATARASCLRWVQSRYQHGSELRLALEDALVEYDPRAFISAVDRYANELGPQHHRLGRKLALRWQRLTDGT